MSKEARVVSLDGIDNLPHQGSLSIMTSL